MQNLPKWSQLGNELTVSHSHQGLHKVEQFHQQMSSWQPIYEGNKNSTQLENLHVCSLCRRGIATFD
jgi:hypothetical protein